VADKYFSERATDYKKGTHVGVMEIKNWSFELLQREGISIVGDPDYVTEQILHQCRTLGTNKIMMRPVFGRLRLHQVKKSLELMAKEVLPNLEKESIEFSTGASASAGFGGAAK
jgi:alkanesulfonate monooxygenase SsuD/methylene tetrahydromethanopterin reductase-like flavin-dependent oxidoreductase (luciferase family)